MGQKQEITNSFPAVWEQIHGSMLNNSESWINLTKLDIETLEKPDTMTQRNIFGNKGNPSKAFMCLELGITPVHFVIMKKRLNF